MDVRVVGGDLGRALHKEASGCSVGRSVHVPMAGVRIAVRCASHTRSPRAVTFGAIAPVKAADARRALTRAGRRSLTTAPFVVGMRGGNVARVDSVVTATPRSAQNFAVHR